MRSLLGSLPPRRRTCLPVRNPPLLRSVEGGPWLGPSERDWLERLTRGVDTPPFGQVEARPFDEVRA
ncbi:MAG TPA: hypothetical protein VNF73_09100 [Candidatus Saccharimonadales bacterium]|nr:hypothetical protein [Candidatus Saccharimonadales bacterium]